MMCQRKPIENSDVCQLIPGNPELLSNRRVSVYLSRQSRNISPDTWWFRAIQTVWQWCRVQGSVPLVSCRPLYQDVIRYVAGRSGSIIELVRTEQDCYQADIFSSVPYPNVSLVPRRRPSSLHAWYVTRDSLLNDLADSVVLIEARSGGQIEKLVIDRIQQKRQVFVFIESGQPVSREAISLIKDGAHPLELALSPVPDVQKRRNTAGSGRAVPLQQWEQDGDYLWHCTRDCPGPWPGQSWANYVDSLLRNEPESAHTAIDTLARIVRTGIIRASSTLIRGGYPVVCFTEHSVEYLQTLRRFHPHRGQWQFLAYAIGIHKEIAREVGARPVRYGSPDLYLQLPEQDRFLFQREGSRNKRQSWNIEREWRIPGDIDLRALDKGSVVVLIPRPAHADDLPMECPWTILSIEGESNFQATERG